ncbi:hypothetical protein ABZ479_34955 [Streptomyces sp. NPDC005722]
MVAWDGEGVSDRISRLAREEAVPLAVTDYEWGTATLLGPQRIAAFVDLVQDAAEADRGMIAEDTTSEGLGYRARSTLQNQRPAPTLDYAVPDLMSAYGGVKADGLGSELGPEGLQAYQRFQSVYRQ